MGQADNCGRGGRLGFFFCFFCVFFFGYLFVVCFFFSFFGVLWVVFDELMLWHGSIRQIHGG